MSIGINFPFKETTVGGVIQPTETTLGSIQSNLIAFLTLRKGQRPMHNDLYSPLYDFIFEQWDAISENEMYDALDSKLKKFFPMIKLEEMQIKSEEDDNTINIKIIYSVPSLGNVTESLGLSFDTNN